METGVLATRPSTQAHPPKGRQGRTPCAPGPRVLPDGIEPPSQRLKGARSATELEKHDRPTYPSGRLGSTQGHLSVGRNLCPVLPDPGNWPTATECSCGLVVGCGLSSSTHELGPAWHQCRQRDARAGFEPAFSRVMSPAGYLFPTQRCAPTSPDVGAKKRLAVPCGIRELQCVGVQAPVRPSIPTRINIPVHSVTFEQNPIRS